MNTIRLHRMWKRPAGWQRFRTAVSLHGHTMHSEESLDSLPRYVRRVPILARAVRALPVDSSRAFWTPPLPALNTLRSEQNQIEGKLGMAALVSLTDHDNIQASTRLQLFAGTHRAPVSMEWTVPLGVSFLHLGVHNLPRAGAHAWVRELQAYTAQPSPELLGQLLDGLNEMRGILIVLNHPLWDEPEVGTALHQTMVHDFLRQHGHSIHALELNGLRPWSENRAVLQLAEASGHVVVSGGDRHGSAPNTLLNLTDAASFAAEIRQDRVSEILLTPQFRGSHLLRWIECILDVVREYPELAGRRHWSDRAFQRREDGSILPLSACWGADAGHFAAIMRLGQSRPLRSALRAVLAVGQTGSLAW